MKTIPSLRVDFAVSLAIMKGARSIAQLDDRSSKTTRSKPNRLGDTRAAVRQTGRLLTM